MEPIPNIFRPIVTMAWQPVVLYEQLSARALSHDEKTFICSEILGEGSYLGILSVKSLSKRYGISRSKMYHWIQNHKQEKIQHPHSGGPACLDEATLTTITAQVVEARNQHTPLLPHEVDKLLVVGAQKLGQKRKAGPYCDKETLSAKTMSNLVLWQQHAQVLTSVGTRAAYLEYQRARDPATIVENRQAEADLRHVRAAEKAELKKQETAAKKAAEIDRLAAMSDTERKAEKMRKKEESAATKAQKQLQKVDKLDASRARIAAKAMTSNNNAEVTVSDASIPVEMEEPASGGMSVPT